MNNKGFGGLIGLLLTIAIICFMAYFMFKQYTAKPTGMTNETQEIVNQAGIDTSSQIGIISSTKSILKSAQDSESTQEQQAANMIAR